MTEAPRNFDAIVIGAGQAGPALAGRLTAAGMQVALVERKLVGGTCVNTGCMPTKTLIASARVAHLARRGPEFGVLTGAIRFDMRVAAARARKVTQDARAGNEAWLASMKGLTFLRGHVRIALSRRWGSRGTGFTEFDVHCPGQDHDPKTADPVRVFLRLEDTAEAPWDADMVADLEGPAVLTDQGRNLIWLRVTCEWNAETEAFEPIWQFLTAAGEPQFQGARRATNTSPFFSYLPIFFLPALRNAADEFGSRSSMWARLLKSVRIAESFAQAPVTAEGANRTRPTLQLFAADHLAAAGGQQRSTLFSPVRADRVRAKEPRRIDTGPQGSSDKRRDHIRRQKRQPQHASQI
jgi:hypothetical protein